MSFLDDLLTFKRTLEHGKELIRVPRTFGYLFTSKPFLYKAHETEAGLYAVLSHHKDGSLYACPGKGEIDQKFDHQSGKKQPIHLSNDFFLHDTYERREKGQSMVLGSSVTKSASHQEIRLAVDISVFYFVTQEGNPDFVQLRYHFPTQHKKVQFTVCRSHSGEAVAAGPLISTKNPSLEKVWRGVNHEATLENLVGLILRTPLTNQEIYGLYNLNYLRQHVLH